MMLESGKIPLKYLNHHNSIRKFSSLHLCIYLDIFNMNKPMHITRTLLHHHRLILFFWESVPFSTCKQVTSMLFIAQPNQINSSNVDF